MLTLMLSSSFQQQEHVHEHSPHFFGGIGCLLSLQA